MVLITVLCKQVTKKLNMEPENINTNNNPVAKNEFEVSPPFLNYVNQNTNQPEGTSVAGSREADEDYYDASDFLQPDEDRRIRVKYLNESLRAPDL